MSESETPEVVELARVRTEKLIAELEAQLQSVAEMLESEFGEDQLAS